MTILEQAHQLRAQTAAESQAAYRQLVVDLANERDVAPETVIEVCEAAGKSLDDLAADQDRHEERVGWAAQMAVGRQAGERADSLTTEINDGDNELARLTKEWHARRARLWAEREHYLSLNSQAVAARNQLVRTAPADIAAREKVLAAERADLARQAERYRGNILTAGNAERRELERAKGNAKRKFESKTATADLAASRRSLEIVGERVVAPNAAALAKCETRLATIESEIAELHARKLAP